MSSKRERERETHTHTLDSVLPLLVHKTRIIYSILVVLCMKHSEVRIIHVLNLKNIPKDFFNFLVVPHFKLYIFCRRFVYIYKDYLFLLSSSSKALDFSARTFMSFNTCLIAPFASSKLISFLATFLRTSLIVALASAT